jgi:hypothetical protein
VAACKIELNRVHVPTPCCLAAPELLGGGSARACHPRRRLMDVSAALEN